jgi:antitoxin component YwqK of YwqJK toxin-antitoxin module
MKTSILFIFLILCSNLFSQTKIYLSYNSSVKNSSPYSLDNPKDSNYIYISNQQDMGYKYGFYYEFVKKIEDGYYQIFINNILNRESFFKNHQLDKKSINYFLNGGIHTIDNYIDGKRSDTSREFYENGQLSSFAEYENDFSFLITAYYQDGKIKSRTFFLPDNSNHHTEYYDENSRIAATYDGNVTSRPILEIENKFKDGILDGVQRYVYENYFYTIEYEMNKLIKFTLRKDGIIVKMKKFR